MLAERVQGLGAGFPQSSLQQDVLLFVRYLLETHPDLVLEVQSKSEPLLCCPHLPMGPCSPQGARDMAGTSVTTSRAGDCHTPLRDVHHSRGSCAHPRVQSLGLQLPQGRATNPA